MARQAPPLPPGRNGHPPRERAPRVADGTVNGSHHHVADAAPAADWSDERLVEACLCGNQAAWDLLIKRYRKLILSFPRKYGAAPDDAADVFQAVCLELFVALPSLRQREAVKTWIATVSAHQAYRWKRRHLTRAKNEEPREAEALGRLGQQAGDHGQAARLNQVRAAVAQLPKQYRGVIESLFFEEPPMPYQAVAERLGVAPGSVSFLRARGLRKLEQILSDAHVKDA